MQRETGLDDEERYVYDGQGQRVRKINSAQASGRTLINEVRYLPGLEIRTTADGDYCMSSRRRQAAMAYGCCTGKLASRTASPTIRCATA